NLHAEARNDANTLHLLDPANVHEIGGRKQLLFHRWQKVRAAGQDLNILAVLGEMAHSFHDAARAKKFEYGKAHGRRGYFLPKNWIRLPALSWMIRFRMLFSCAGQGPMKIGTLWALSAAMVWSRSSTIIPALVIPWTKSLLVIPGETLLKGIAL